VTVDNIKSLPDLERIPIKAVGIGKGQPSMVQEKPRSDLRRRLPPPGPGGTQNLVQAFLQDVPGEVMNPKSLVEVFFEEGFRVPERVLLPVAEHLGQGGLILEGKSVLPPPV
jgi:hypothetical protein